MGVVTEESNPRPKGLGIRHVQTGLLFLAMLLAFTMRVNMSMAIVDMTDDRNDSYFDWSHSVQSVILSSFFWGYVILQVPAGELARRFGGKPLITISVSVNSLISLALPFAADIAGWKLVCVCRILQGFTQAFIYPCMHHLISQWVPLQEKGLLSTIIYAGGQLGIAIQLLSAGFIASAWGWEGIFYTNGVLGAIWTVLYLILGADSPESSKYISKEEVLYIQRSLGRVGEQKRYPAPWGKILTSLPFWAVIAGHCGQNWGFFTLMTEMPTYMSKVLGVDLKSNGVLSSLPYLSMYILSFPMGAMTDLIIRRKWLSVSTTRKLFNTIGLWGPAVALIGLSYSPAGNLVLAVVMITVSVGINAGTYVGYMTEPSEWRKVFFVASGVYFFTNLFFILFATSERQPWNEPKETEDSIADKQRDT
ncbi:hypothetical protein K1T71_008058 [Dendrolimus kikuchii]|uniref:Uncharacterized protein n=1 Tax=Dendrolimus kikuchii TaxID=765133 RepID=A0ACC1CYT9_9NEOP|nr:hypothetical protein K1T71_008058 [Dendrolimus kikuchii]